MSFSESLAQGRVAESQIAKWLMIRGAAVMPAYEIEKQRFCGPQLFTNAGGFIAPDLLVFRDSGMLWVEAKHKSVFTWHRNSGKWTTGIDLHHYGQYMHVSKQTQLPVWLLFFHREETPDARDAQHGCPSKCPTGLFGGELFDLVGRENHRSQALTRGGDGATGHGKSGMVYWAEGSLKKLQSKEEFLQIVSGQKAA